MYLQLPRSDIFEKRMYEWVWKGIVEKYVSLLSEKMKDCTLYDLEL